MCMWRKWTQAHAGLVHQNSKQSTCRRLMTFDASITNNLLDTIYQTDVPKNRSISPCLECSQFRVLYAVKQHNFIPVFGADIFLSRFFQFEKSLLENIKSNYSMNVWKKLDDRGRWGESGGKKAASNRCRYSFWCHWKPRTLIELRFLFPSIVRCAIDKSSIILCVHVHVHVSGGYVRSTLRVCGFR